MATVQSLWAKGNQQSKRPQTAGAVHAQLYSFDASAGLLAADILEIGELPPDCQIVDAMVFTEGTFTGITANVGLMTGAYGDADSVRTVGTEIYAAADLTTFARLVQKSTLLIAPSQAARGIGVQVSGNVAAGAGKKIHLMLFYAQ